MPEIKSRRLTPAASSILLHRTEAPSLSAPFNDVFGSPRTNQVRPFRLLARRHWFHQPLLPLLPEFFDFIKELTSFLHQRMRLEDHWKLCRARDMLETHPWERWQDPEVEENAWMRGKRQDLWVAELFSKPMKARNASPQCLEWG